MTQPELPFPKPGDINKELLLGVIRDHLLDTIDVITMDAIDDNGELDYDVMVDYIIAEISECAWDDYDAEAV